MTRRKANTTSKQANRRPNATSAVQPRPSPSESVRWRAARELPTAQSPRPTAAGRNAGEKTIAERARARAAVPEAVLLATPDPGLASQAAALNNSTAPTVVATINLES